MQEPRLIHFKEGDTTNHPNDKELKICNCSVDDFWHHVKGNCSSEYLEFDSCLFPLSACYPLPTTLKKLKITNQSVLKDEISTHCQILTVKRSLQVVKMLASTTGATREHLRREISEDVFTIGNIRDILRYGERHPTLQKLGIEILTSLALEEDATERIGGTGGILKELFNIFFKEAMPQNQNHVRIAFLSSHVAHLMILMNLHEPGDHSALLQFVLGLGSLLDSSISGSTLKSYKLNLGIKEIQ